MEQFTPFTTSFYIDNYKELDLAPVKNFCFSLQEQEPDGVKLSNMGGWQSRAYTFVHEELTPIYERLYANISLLYPLYGISKKPKLANCWININRKTHFNLSHDHPQSYLSACFYVKCPTHAGSLVFERPDNLRLFIDADTNTPANFDRWIIPIEEKKVIIFPSYVKHYVEPNLTDSEDDARISIAFNFS